MTKRFLGVVASIGLAGLLAACGSSTGNTASSTPAPAGSSSGTSAAAAALPKSGKVGVIISTSASEVIVHWTETAKNALKEIGWEALVTDGKNDPAQYQQAINGWVSQKVDGIITISVDGAPVAASLKAAKEAGIPVIATGIGVDPSGADLFSAFYAPSDEKLGQVLAEYLTTKVGAGAEYVTLDLTAVYGAHAPVVAATPILAAAGFKNVGTHDISVADIVGSAAKGTVDLIQAHPNAKLVFGCCDFTAPITVPALEAAGKGDVLQSVRYDNLSTLKLIADGAPVIAAATNADTGLLIALDQILKHAATGADVDPKADQADGTYEYEIVDKSNVPAAGAFRFDPAEQIATFVTKWKSEYSLS